VTRQQVVDGSSREKKKFGEFFEIGAETGVAQALYQRLEKQRSQSSKRKGWTPDLRDGRIISLHGRKKKKKEKKVPSSKRGGVGKGGGGGPRAQRKKRRIFSSKRGTM